MPDLDGFEKRADEVRKHCLAMREPLIVNHYDCDGITSGSIVCAALSSAGKKFHVRTVKKVDDALIEALKAEKEIIFTDLGGGSERVNELSADVAIIDHHQTANIGALQLNPHLFGFDGGTEISAAGTAYFVFHQNLELAIVGAIGDMQYPLISLNRKVLEKGEKEGSVKAELDLRMYGRHNRPLPQLLAYADDPFLPMLGGHEDRCAAFLESIGIEKTKEAGANGKWQTYSQLAITQKRALVGALAVHLAENAYSRAKNSASGAGEKNPAEANGANSTAGTDAKSPVDIKSELLVGETYLLPKYAQVPELYDAGEFSTMLNACGRHNEASLGMDVCLGKEGALEKGRALLAEHRRALREGIEFAYRNTRDLGPFLFLDGRGIIEEGIIGVVAGMLYPGGRVKPILAAALDEKPERMKISTRGTKKLVANGLNLGLALREACAEVGGAGGGHHIAAGATIPTAKLDAFLQTFAQKIKTQTGGA